MKKNKFTDEYGYMYDYDGPETDDARSGNDVSFELNIYDKNKKLVHTSHLSYPSIPFRDQLEKDMLEEAEKIIDDIRPKTQEEWAAIFKNIRSGLNEDPKNENYSFNDFFHLRNA
jgi:hypothetical protein